MGLFNRKKTPSISWWVPRWSYVPSHWRTWNKIFFDSKSMLKVLAISIFIFAVIVVWAKINNPLLQLGFLWKAPIGILGLHVVMYAQLVILCLIKPIARVQAHRIVVQHGQNAWFVEADAIRKIRLVVFDKARVRLRIWYVCRDKPQSRTIGVSRKVDLDKLCDLLPVKPEVWDARRTA